MLVSSPSHTKVHATWNLPQEYVWVPAPVKIQRLFPITVKPACPAGALSSLQTPKCIELGLGGSTAEERKPVIALNCERHGRLPLALGHLSKHELLIFWLR